MYYKCTQQFDIEVLVIELCLFSSILKSKIHLLHLFPVVVYLNCLIVGSESDSTDEPVVGNVNKFAVVPPGYTGRPKKGHLIFDACFECGKFYK